MLFRKKNILFLLCPEKKYFGSQSRWKKKISGNFLTSSLIFSTTFEPRHDKTNKMSVRPAKTQINWASAQSLCAQWVAKDPRFLHADSEDSDQTGRMFRLT